MCSTYKLKGTVSTQRPGTKDQYGGWADSMLYTHQGSWELPSINVLIVASLWIGVTASIDKSGGLGENQVNWPCADG